MCYRVQQVYYISNEHHTRTASINNLGENGTSVSQKFRGTGKKIPHIETYDVIQYKHKILNTNMLIFGEKLFIYNPSIYNVFYYIFCKLLFWSLKICNSLFIFVYYILIKFPKMLSV